MARERHTEQQEAPAPDPAATPATEAASSSHESFTDDGPLPAVAASGSRGSGGPEIAPTAKAMGANMVTRMNQVNGMEGGLYDLDHGVKYDYNRRNELQREGRMDLWKEEYRMGHNHSGMFINPWENGTYMRFELKKGKSASEGVKAWLAGVTIAECNSAVIAMEIDTLRKAVGDDKFDAKFGSNDPKIDKGVSAEERLVIAQGGHGTPVAGLLGKTKLGEIAAARDKSVGVATDEEKEKHLVPGEWYYFYNHPKYLLKHPGGAWQGENSLYMGKNDAGERMWSGMGATDKTEDAMVDEMVGAYNQPRDEADEREMVERRIKTKSGKYTIFKKYDPAAGEFPDTVTAKEILDAPAYKLDGTTRKGGFLPASGMALDPKKVKHIVDNDFD